VFSIVLEELPQRGSDYFMLAPVVSIKLRVSCTRARQIQRCGCGPHLFYCLQRVSNSSARSGGIQKY